MKDKPFDIAEYLATYGFRKTDSIESEGDVYIKGVNLLAEITKSYIHLYNMTSSKQGWVLRFSDQIPTSADDTNYLEDALERWA